MKEIRIKVDSEKCNYMERVNYELRFTKDIIQRLLESHPNDPDIINGATFKQYQKQGAELEAEYNAIASEMEAQYLPPELNGHKYSWIIPNNSNEMIITILCECEIEGLEKYQQ